LGDLLSSPIIMRPWPRWLRLAQAREYSGLSERRLKELAQGRVVVGFPDPDDRRGRVGEGVWIFDRESLDAYRMAQAGSDTISRVADKLMRA
jgi:hypothetical protein